VNRLGIGIACFSTFGGSGVVAAEVATSLVRRGHRVHLFSDQVPGRLAGGGDQVVFHPVEVRDFPQLKHPPYTLALTSKIVEVSRRERLDVVHAHYAVPHAASAYLARQVIAADGEVAPPRIVTTLHGTDITLVGSDASFLPLTRFTIMASDAVTVPSAWLREATFAALGVPRSVAIDVVPNFVDADRFAPGVRGEGRGAAPVIVHVSNFRPLKRVDDVVRVFARVRAAADGARAILRLVGDGPERPRVAALARELGVGSSVEMLGERMDLPEVLRDARVFLLPSATESFGLAALEAMACGVPVVASAVGGVPEVVQDGEGGFLRPAGDVAGMADAVLRLLADGGLAARMSAAARRRAETAFRREPAVDRYLEIYQRVLAISSSSSSR
jgi:N-acetyl-alpha-D-glucosaminyl L-malate synthase BshA